MEKRTVINKNKYIYFILNIYMSSKIKIKYKSKYVLNIGTANKIKMRRGAVSIHEVEDIKEGEYLDNVIVIMPNGNENALNLEPSIRDQILNPNIMNLTNAENKINDIIDQVTGKKEGKMNKDAPAVWINCVELVLKKSYLK